MITEFASHVSQHFSVILRSAKVCQDYSGAADLRQFGFAGNYQWDFYGDSRGTGKSLKTNCLLQTLGSLYDGSLAGPLHHFEHIVFKIWLHQPL